MIKDATDMRSIQDKLLKQFFESKPSNEIKNIYLAMIMVEPDKNKRPFSSDIRNLIQYHDWKIHVRTKCCSERINSRKETSLIGFSSDLNISKTY